MPILESGSVRVLSLDAEGPLVSTAEHAIDIIGSTWGLNVTMVAVPASRLDPRFFDLSSLIAGEIIQKFVNYRLQLAILGDISSHVVSSDALHDFVWESNRGEHVWFLANETALVEKLAARSV